MVDVGHLIFYNLCREANVLLQFSPINASYFATMIKCVYKENADDWLRCKKLQPLCQETSLVFDGIGYIHTLNLEFHVITSARTSFVSAFWCWSIWTSCFFYGNVYGFGSGGLIYWWKWWRSPEIRVLYRLM